MVIGMIVRRRCLQYVIQGGVADRLDVRARWQLNETVKSHRNTIGGHIAIRPRMDDRYFSAHVGRRIGSHVVPMHVARDSRVRRSESPYWAPGLRVRVARASVCYA